MKPSRLVTFGRVRRHRDHLPLPVTGAEGLRMKKVIMAALGGALLSGALLGTGTANAYPGELATGVCAFLDANPSTSYTINRYFNLAVSAGLDSYAAGAQLDASVSNYCPWHLSQLNYYRAQQGVAPLPYPGGRGGVLA